MRMGMVGTPLVCLGIAVLLATSVAAQTPRPPIDTYKPSPNYSSGNNPRYVVIHTVQGSYAGCLSWFATSRSRVSAHYTVAKDGRLGQSLTHEKAGWHAGNSSYNRQSIGIEHEGYVSDPNNYTDAMLRTSAQLTRHLCDTYRIPIDRQHIIGHVEVPGATHTDPGKHFPWSLYIQMVKNAGSGGGPAPAPTPAPAPAPAPSGVRAVEVTAGTLNVRAGIWGTQIGHVHNGARLVQIAEQSGWAKVWFHGRSAWISKSYTRPLTSGSVEEVTTSVLNVRTGASTGYSVVGQARSGQRYVRSGSSGSWRKVHFGHYQRWFHGGYSKTLSIGG